MRIEQQLTQGDENNDADIAAKNMAGKETVDSNMLSACSLPAPLHNAIVCANRWFCWHRLYDYKAADRASGVQCKRSAVKPVCKYRRYTKSTKEAPGVPGLQGYGEKP